MTILVPHIVLQIILEQKTAHLSAARWLKYNTILLELPNVHVKRCTVFNPATLLPLPGDGEPDNCISAITEVCSPRSDMQETPLPNADLKLFVNGSASRNPDTGKNRAGYFVVTVHDIIETERLPSKYSAQAAELVALTKAYEHVKAKT